MDALVTGIVLAIIGIWLVVKSLLSDRRVDAVKELEHLRAEIKRKEAQTEIDKLNKEINDAKVVYNAAKRKLDDQHGDGG